MDEKTGIQALDRTQPVLPLRSGKPRRWSNEYVRHGTRTLPAAVEIETGKATTWVNKTRKSVDFIAFMDQVVGEYPGQRLCVVMDNLNTHNGKMAQEWLEKNMVGEKPTGQFPLHADARELGQSRGMLLLDPDAQRTSTTGSQIQP